MGAKRVNHSTEGPGVGAKRFCIIQTYTLGKQKFEDLKNLKYCLEFWKREF